MGIPKSDVWICPAESQGHSATNLANDDEAPDHFASQDAICDYVQNNYAIGEYQILRVDQTVTVDPAHEMYSEYSDADLEAVESATAQLKELDTVLWAKKTTDPSGREIQLERDGVRLELAPADVDVVVEVLLDEREMTEVVDWVAEHASGLRVVGWKSDTHYESRGSRGQSSVRIGLVRDIAPVTSLVEYVKSIDEVLFCVPADATMFESRLTCRPTADWVVVTAVPLPRDTKHIDDTPTPQQVMETVTDELAAFDETLLDETDWEVSDWGFVTTTAYEEFYLLAAGVHHNAVSR